MAELSALLAKYKGRVDALEETFDDAAGKVVDRTPIDTGAAKASYKKARSGDFIYFTSPLPYMRRLEYGHSKQAPGGMVRITMAEMPAMARAKLSGS